MADAGVQNTNADLLIFNGVLGVSENIVVQPSALQAGQVFDNNAATGTPIAVVNYTLNTNIIVNGSSPAGHGRRYRLAHLCAAPTRPIRAPAAMKT